MAGLPSSGVLVQKKTTNLRMTCCALVGKDCFSKMCFVARLTVNFAL